MIRLHSARIAAALLSVLMLALLGAQWTGMQHRVAHAWIAASPADYAAAAPDDDVLEPAHSCTLFDGAALAAALHSGFFLPVCARAVMAGMRPPDTSPRQAHPYRHFSPRGPPLG